MITTIAPIVPFVSEAIYQNLVLSVDKDAPESVHLQDFPTEDESKIDHDLLNKIDTIIKAVEMGRSARNKANIRTRQPLANILFKVKHEKEKAYIIELADQIKEELNIKTVTLIDDIDTYVSYEAKPNFTTLGKKIGKQMPQVVQGLKNIDGAVIAAQIQRGESIVIDGITIEPGDINISIKEKTDVVAVEDHGYVAILDVNITEELKNEGFGRDLVRSLNNVRKEDKLDVDERIDFSYKEASNYVITISSSMQSYIEKETLSNYRIDDIPNPDFENKIFIGNEKIIVNIKRNKKT